jgi:hypothetical protein
MDGARGARLPITASFRLRASQAKCGCSLILWGSRGTCEQKSSDGAFLQEKVAHLDRPMMKKAIPKGFAEADRIIHHLLQLYPQLKEKPSILLSPNGPGLHKGG